jgi:hypothetical protein
MGDEVPEIKIMGVSPSDALCIIQPIIVGINPGALPSE